MGKREYIVDEILEELKTKSNQFPELRLCQLLYCIYAEGGCYDPFFFTDEEFLGLIKQFPKNVDLKNIDLDR